MVPQDHMNLHMFSRRKRIHTIYASYMEIPENKSKGGVGGGTSPLFLITWEWECCVHGLISETNKKPIYLQPFSRQRSCVTHHGSLFFLLAGF